MAVLGLIAVSYGYFELCKTVGMFVAWSFLAGYLPAFPLAYLAARAEMRQRPCWQVAGWTILAFTLFFWSCAAFWWLRGLAEDGA